MPIAVAAGVGGMEEQRPAVAPRAAIAELKGMVQGIIAKCRGGAFAHKGFLETPGDTGSEGQLTANGDASF